MPKLSRDQLVAVVARARALAYLSQCEASAYATVVNALRFRSERGSEILRVAAIQWRNRLVRPLTAQRQAQREPCLLGVESQR